MELAPDLTPDVLAAAMPERPLRTYPAVLSTHADALAWARAGAPAGAVVVAGYQASPRGRGGLPWQVRPERDLAFSLVLRPILPPQREGWVYAAAVSGLAETLEGTIEWPDEVRCAGERAAAVSAEAELGPAGVRFAVVSVLALDARPRPQTLAHIAQAIEERLADDAAAVLDAYRAHCATIGRRVRARLVPLGPGGPEVDGVAVDVLADGALVLERADGRRVAVRPQNLGLLEAA